MRLLLFATILALCVPTASAAGGLTAGGKIDLPGDDICLDYIGCITPCALGGCQTVGAEREHVKLFVTVTGGTVEFYVQLLP